MNPFRRSPQGEAPESARSADDFFRDRREAAGWMAGHASALLSDAENLVGDEESAATASLYASLASGYSALGALNLTLADNGDEESDLWPSYFVPKSQDGTS